MVSAEQNAVCDPDCVEEKCLSQCWLPKSVDPYSSEDRRQRKKLEQIEEGVL